MLSPEPSCPYNPSIDSVDTTPSILDTDKLDKSQQPIALRKSKREKKAPDVLTYPVAETAPKSKRVSKGKDSGTKVKELKAFVDSKNAPDAKKAKTDTISRPNFWAMKQAWLNKLRKLRQDPEYIKKQQAIVAKFKSEYIPYKWNKDLSTYENLYRSKILENREMKLPHYEIIKSVNQHIKRALPINTTPLSLSVSPEQLSRLKLTSMPIDRAIEIVQNISTNQDEPMDKFMKYMEALRTIEKLPKNVAIPTLVPKSRAESVPVVEPLFSLDDTNTKAMSIVEDYLERKYDQTVIDELLASHGAMETTSKLPATCSMGVMMDSMLTNLEENILTDKDLNNFEKEIQQIVMEKHGITSPDDPILEEHINAYMKTLPELTEDDFKDAEDAEYVTEEKGDLISELSESLEKLSIGDTPQKVGDKRARGIGKAITAKLKFRRPKKLAPSTLKVFKKPSMQKMKMKPKPNTKPSTKPKPKKQSQYGGTRKKHKTKRHKAQTRRMRGKKHMRKIIRGGHGDTIYHD